MSEAHAGQENPVAPSQKPAGPQSQAPVTEEIEVIIARQLAGYLAFPVVIMDPSHVVVFYNEPAERMLGRLYEGDEIRWTDWTRTFQFTDDNGEPIPAADMPLGIAMRERRVSHRTFHLRGLDGIRHQMDEIAIPLLSTSGRFLGAIALFVETDDPGGDTLIRA
jgi:hypothetical protein